MRAIRSSGATSARVDEGADAEGDEDATDDPHECLLDGCSGPPDGRPKGHTDDVDEAGCCEEEAEQADAYGNVHPQHSFLHVFGFGEEPEEHEEEAESAGDQSCGGVTASSYESNDPKENQEDAKDDGELSHGFALLLLPEGSEYLIAL